MNLPNRIEEPGKELASSAAVFGECLRDEMKRNQNFYFFSPDETTSNRLSAVFEASDRAWSRRIEPWDQHLAKDGRIIEMLSENTLFAVLTGHILSGGSGCMTSYESFFPIIGSQLDQHLKFIKQSMKCRWRSSVPALNLLSTSCWQRQDHNGYTHQNPALISTLLAKPSNLVNCFFPADDVSAAAIWDYMMHTKNVVNLTTFNKNPQPRWIDINHARFQMQQGCSIYQFASDDNPDVVVAAVGDIPTTEMLAAIHLAKEQKPELRVRFVGIAALSYGAIGTTTAKLKQAGFDEYFTTDKPIVVNFHGYAETMRGIMAHYTNLNRVSVHGYCDHGSTTSPMDELARNNCSRYQLAADILKQAGYPEFYAHFRQIVDENAEHSRQTGLDLDI